MFWTLSLVAAAALVLAAPPAGAAVLGPTAPGTAAAARDAAMRLDVDYRRCWRRKGRTHCRWYAEPDDYGPREGSGRIVRQPEYDSRKLPFGSKIWWEQIERESGDRR